MKGKFKYILFLLLLFLGTVIFMNGQDNYPVPPKTKNMLFYFQRSHNKNTIIYDLNTLPDGAININKPINAYWIRYEEGGVRKDLSFFQRKAFGLQWQLTDKLKESFVLHFNSFKKKEIYLLKANETINYKAYIIINGELSELSHMFIKSENNSFGVPLSVQYIDIYGINLKTEKTVIERYKP